VNHECPAEGCTRTVNVSMLLCRPHWFMVPRPLRNAVWVTWADGAGEGTLAHCQAIRAAIRVVDGKLTEAGR
jgi:hypothetical protein